MSKLPPSVLDEPLLSDQEHEVEINVESGKSPNRKAEFLSQVTNKSRSSIRARLFAVLLLHLLDVSSMLMEVNGRSYGISITWTAKPPWQS